MLLKCGSNYKLKFKCIKYDFFWYFGQLHHSSGAAFKSIQYPVGTLSTNEIYLDFYAVHMFLLHTKPFHYACVH